MTSEYIKLRDHFFALIAEMGTRAMLKEGLPVEKSAVYIEKVSAFSEALAAIEVEAFGDNKADDIADVGSIFSQPCPLASIRRFEERFR